MLKQILQHGLGRFSYGLAKLSRDLRRPVDCSLIDILDLLVHKRMHDRRETFILQVGANDGSDEIGKLIRKYHLPGLLVEPQPDIFNRLVRSYADQPQLKFANVVISDHDGSATFHSLRPDLNLPDRMSEAASLDRNQTMKILSWWRKSNRNLNLPANLESLIEERNLPACTVRTLLKEHEINNVDLLMIDTIGFDFEIIKMVPFEDIKPAIIQFEHALLSQSDQHACYSYLRDLGYSFAQVSMDTIACQAEESRPGRILAWPKL